jgi:hypothetical protein
MDYCNQILDKRAFCKMNAEHFRNLIQNDDEANARLLHLYCLRLTRN